MNFSNRHRERDVSDPSTDNERLRAALRRSMVALDDWLNIYAEELCDNDRVKEAKQRISEYGTLSYIALVQDQNRAALNAEE